MPIICDLLLGIQLKCIWLKSANNALFRRCLRREYQMQYFRLNCFIVVVAHSQDNSQHLDQVDQAADMPDNFELDDSFADDSRHAKRDSLLHQVVHMDLVVVLDTVANRYFGQLVAVLALASIAVENLALKLHKSLL